MQKKMDWARLKGVGLLEIMLVLAITAVILIVSVRYYSSAQAGATINASVNEFGEVKSAFENYLSDSNNCPYVLSSPGVACPASGTVVQVTNLVSMGYLPNAFVATTGSGQQQQTQAVNPFGGTITIAVPNGMLQIEQTGIPAQACTVIVSRLESTMNSALGESATCQASGSSGSNSGETSGPELQTASATYVM